jgi:hypothetical protein
MDRTVDPDVPPRHPVLPEARPRMAKASLRKPDIWRAQIGRALRRALALQGWSLKEFAAAVDRDPRQCARWITGVERAQLDVLFAVDVFRLSLVQALAEVAGAGVEIETTIRLRRPA